MSKQLPRFSQKKYEDILSLLDYAYSESGDAGADLRKKVRDGVHAVDDLLDAWVPKETLAPKKRKARLKRKPARVFTDPDPYPEYCLMNSSRGLVHLTTAKPFSGSLCDAQLDSISYMDRLFYYETAGSGRICGECCAIADAERQRKEETNK